MTVLDERDCAVLVRLTKKEKQALQKKAKLSSMKMEPFIRKLIMGVEIKARPPNEYVQLIREVNAIGNNINQIAHLANAEGRINQEKIQEVLKCQSDLIRLVRGLR